MTTTNHLSLPLVQQSQAQKEVTVNEALAKIDALLNTGAMSLSLPTPPASPNEGDLYIIGDAAADEWAGRENNITYFDHIWRFITPREGVTLWVNDEDRLYSFDGSAWIASGDGGGDSSELQNINLLGVNTTADITNKFAVASDAMLFNHNGNGMQVKVNKSNESDSASLLFQSNFAGHAEIGLTGDNDFHFKVSPDGSTFHESILLDKNTGTVDFPNGSHPNLRPATVTESGGPTEFYGPPNTLTICDIAGGASIADGRMYFTPFYVDRPSALTGCFTALYQASTTAGALVRVGVYHLGQVNGTNWDIGNRIADFGTATAEVAGHKIFTLGTPQTLEPGWYAMSYGISGAGAATRYSKWHTPGVASFIPYGSGSSAQIRCAGATVYIYENNCSAEITNGLPATWSKNPSVDYINVAPYQFMFAIPKWQA